MVVIVRRKVNMGGFEYEAKKYLPEDVLLTKDKKDKAKELDNILENRVKNINKLYDKLPVSVKKISIDKWRWLGKEIDKIFKEVNIIEAKDKDEYTIWPAIGQFFRKELSAGMDDKKRSGTKNDHYRKCWALYTLKYTEWIKEWIGWDQLVERGEQLIHNEIILKLLSEKIGNVNPKIKGKEEYAALGKLLVEKLPSLKSKKNISAFTEQELEEIINTVTEAFLKTRNNL
ncbi:hypothetical protein ES705_20887 [subsurface metagenome]